MVRLRVFLIERSLSSGHYFMKGFPTAAYPISAKEVVL